MGIASKIENELGQFPVITLEEISKASLMRRKDSKYIFEVEKLPSILKQLSTKYSVLDIQGIRAQSYETLYFDTPSMDMYQMHHNGRVNRHKVRLRRYGSSKGAFLEVKKKNSRGITIKNRVQTNGEESSVLSTEEEFLCEFTPYVGAEITPVLRNNFKRITLVSADQQERITLDFQLWFASEISDRTIEIPGISIAEIKYQGFLASSRFHSVLRQNAVHPRRFSKYCMGMALLNDNLKKNLFKEKLRYMMKINAGYLRNQTEKAYA